MNDDEVLTAARDSFSEVRMQTPLELTVHRGRLVRGRRRGYRAAAFAGTAAMAAVAAVGLSTTGTSAPPSPHNGDLALAAWTVTHGPDHAVDVTVRQLLNPAGLQRALRADGIPARVDFQSGQPTDSPPLPAGCSNVAMSDEANAKLQAKILGVTFPNPYSGVAFTFYPQKIPHGIGIYLAVESSSSNHNWGWGLDLVQTAQSCTG